MLKDLLEYKKLGELYDLFFNKDAIILTEENEKIPLYALNSNYTTTIPGILYYNPIRRYANSVRSYEGILETFFKKYSRAMTISKTGERKDVQSLFGTLLNVTDNKLLAILTIDKEHFLELYESKGDIDVKRLNLYITTDFKKTPCFKKLYKEFSDKVLPQVRELKIPIIEVSNIEPIVYNKLEVELKTPAQIRTFKEGLLNFVYDQHK